jgi:hypothetical protein
VHELVCTYLFVASSPYLFFGLITLASSKSF